MTDLHERLKAAVTQRLELARSYECQESRAADAPGNVVRYCERDLKVLDRHRPNFDRECCLSCCFGTYHATYGRSTAPWPCYDIRDLAEVYGVPIEVTS